MTYDTVLQQLQQKVALKKQLEAKLNDLREQRKVFDKQVIELRVAHRSEQEDVEKLEGKSLVCAKLHMTDSKTGIIISDLCRGTGSEYPDYHLADNANQTLLCYFEKQLHNCCYCHNNRQQPYKTYLEKAEPFCKGNNHIKFCCLFQIYSRYRRNYEHRKKLQRNLRYVTDSNCSQCRLPFPHIDLL